MRLYGGGMKRHIKNAHDLKIGSILVGKRTGPYFDDGKESVITDVKAAPGGLWYRMHFKGVKKKQEVDTQYEDLINYYWLKEK